MSKSRLHVGHEATRHVTQNSVLDTVEESVSRSPMSKAMKVSF